MFTPAILTLPTPVRVTNRIFPSGTMDVELSLTPFSVTNLRAVVAILCSASAPVIQGIDLSQYSGALVLGVPPPMNLSVISPSGTNCQSPGYLFNISELLGIAFQLCCRFVALGFQFLQGEIVPTMHVHASRTPVRWISLAKGSLGVKVSGVKGVGSMRSSISAARRSSIRRA